MDRCEQAVGYHKKGFNCCQSVLAAFQDVIGLTETQCLTLGGGFGAGAGTGELFGAVTGAVSWSKSRCSGYQIAYCTNRSFRGAKSVFASGKSTSASTGNVAKNKTYFVRIRAYHQIGKKRYYSRWSSVQSCRI